MFTLRDMIGPQPGGARGSRGRRRLGSDAVALVGSPHPRAARGHAGELSRGALGGRLAGRRGPPANPGLPARRRAGTPAFRRRLGLGEGRPAAGGGRRPRVRPRRPGHRVRRAGGGVRRPPFRKRVLAVLSPSGFLGDAEAAWPGMRPLLRTKDVDAMSGATSRPWIDSNAWYGRLARALLAPKTLWLAFEPPDTGQPMGADAYLQAIADTEIAGRAGWSRSTRGCASGSPRAGPRRGRRGRRSPAASPSSRLTGPGGPGSRSARSASCRTTRARTSSWRSRW